ncbi:MAG: Ig-like domain-containing protein [Burkholderiaceae bacterium]|nr:Ig-like domain-containing protein [Burkholderiaceae bacterium]
MRQIKYLLAVFLTGLLVACGGGGGNPGTNPFLPPPTSTSPATPTAAVAIYNSAGTSVTSISVGSAYTAKATILDGSGKPVSGVLVTFSLSGASIAVLSPSTALTDSNGVAQVAISPASISSIGAATLAANATVSGTAVSASLDFAVQASSLTLSPVTVGSTSLPSGGNTQVQVTALIGGVPSTAVPVNVNFTVSCGRINGKDTSGGGVSVTTDGSGIATATYDAATSSGGLCSGSVTIVAASAGISPQSTAVNVAAPSANAIVFVSATPAQIYLANTGNVEQSIVKFRVLSSAGTAMPNVPVRFTIVVNPGGVGIGSAGSYGAKTETTLQNGEVSVSVFSGTIPGPVKIRAELQSSPGVFAESQNLTVASGPPSQKYMSLAVETFNIEGWNIDGTSTQLTVRIADRQGNAVADGTVVNFTAEGGQVARSCATAMINGISQCVVTFQSQNPRPTGGRGSILAYLEGTKDYVDANGNNQYDAGIDTLINQGDAYRDDNENGQYDAGEFLIPRFGSQSCAGTGEPFPSRVNTCDSTLATTVRQQAVILFTSSNPLMTPISIGTSGISFKLSSLDNPLLPLPSGTSVTAEALDTDSTDGLNCSVAGSVLGSPIPNVNPGTNASANLSTSHAVALKDCSSGDLIKINVRVPSGLTTTFPISLP